MSECSRGSDVRAARDGAAWHCGSYRGGATVLVDVWSGARRPGGLAEAQTECRELSGTSSTASADRLWLIPARQSAPGRHVVAAACVSIPTSEPEPIAAGTAALSPVGRVAPAGSRSSPVTYRPVCAVATGRSRR